VCKVVVVMMDREEWMYKILRVGADLSFLGHVRKFVAAAKKHRLRLGRERTICRAIAVRTSFSRKMTWCNLTLIRRGFVKDYTVWKYHGEEADPSSTGASGENS
jgi:hypothetical protein